MEKILLVNDCKFESMILKDMLKNLGYEVSITNEYEAISEIRDFVPDIMICNLIMKETKGNLLIQKVKTLQPEIKCYLSSSSPLKLEDFKNYKVDDVIHTPISKEMIAKKLRVEDYREKKALSLDTEQILKKLGEKKVVTKNKSDDKPPVNNGLSSEMKKNSMEKIEIKIDDTGKNSKNIVFCPYCGEKLEKREAKYLFCPYCGSKL